MGLLLMIYFVYVSQNDMFDLYKEFKAEYGFDMNLALILHSIGRSV